MPVDSLKGLTVVAIDDEMMLLTIVKSILGSCGALAYGAISVGEGKKLIQEKMPDLIILDRHLKDDDGIRFMKELKSDKELSDIPVLMLTGENREGEIDKAMNVGAAWYVLKPFEPKMLVDRAVCAINKEKRDSKGDLFYVDS